MHKQTLKTSLRYLDSWLRLRREQLDIPGLVVAVRLGGELVFNAAYGQANLETNEALTPEHIFRVASHTKSVTATALLQLAEQGKLHLDDTAAKYVPWLAEHKDTRFQHITLRQLLSHSAGIIREGLDGDYWQVMRPFPAGEAFKREILEAELVLEHNLKFKYSNVGYGLLGLVLEQVSGQSFAEYVREHIVQPLGLNDFGPELDPAVADRLATGYGRRHGDKRLPCTKAINTGALAAAAGCYATAADLTRYFAAHIVGSGELLNDESKKEMQRAQQLIEDPDEKCEYGLGLTRSYIHDHQLFGHGGGFPGHITQTYCDPEQGLVVSVLTNCVDGAAGELGRGVLSILYQFDEHAAETTEHNLTRFEGRFMHLWQTIDVVALGKELVAVHADVPFPFSHMEKLAFVDDRTLKISKPQPYISDAEGELVHYDFGEDGTAAHIRYASQSMWPEHSYLEQQANRRSIG